MKTNPSVLTAAAVAVLLSCLPLHGRPDRGEQPSVRQFALQVVAAPSAPPAAAAPPAPSSPAASLAPSAPSAPPAPAAPGANSVVPPGSATIPPADAVPSLNPTLSQTHIKGSALVGRAVLNHRNEKLGDINDLVMELATGRVSSLIVAFDDRLALVPLTAFRFDSRLQLLRVNITKEALKTFPAP